MEPWEAPDRSPTMHRARVGETGGLAFAAPTMQPLATAVLPTDRYIVLR